MSAMTSDLGCDCSAGFQWWWQMRLRRRRIECGGDRGTTPRDEDLRTRRERPAGVIGREHRGLAAGFCRCWSSRQGTAHRNKGVKGAATDLELPCLEWNSSLLQSLRCCPGREGCHAALARRVRRSSPVDRCWLKQEAAAAVINWFGSRDDESGCGLPYANGRR
ncbi:unnamed protein product [Cuscuta campestris]|uniref:Uncharacterized protein n=1 Tax=Cuscuta campestris TaxID=132261 RepID=A0A484KD82_9ASTE|nr:unnamed protein product [Cuscuta campestris]